uniref:Uncharacterized protein n=1 Tax=uncultured Rhodospirillales bacterium HF0500_02H05 TaxID=723610 RepID=E7C4Q6_9PROT|nr:hypothetical protein [uncultured Rhodospirillales bacterium HF0500_02H05]
MRASAPTETQMGFCMIPVSMTFDSGQKTARSHENAFREVYGRKPAQDRGLSARSTGN